MSPNFDKYVSRTPDKGNTRYTLPRPGLLTHGTTYYWHVKAKDSNGVWGPWSDTWSFTAQGPAYPIDVALIYDADTGIGTLRWNANRAYYRVVAVDGNDKRSGDSDYVEAPRPFIYSTPVTTAPAGQLYHYQVKVIRSIGDLTRRDAAKPKPGTRFWKIEPLKFSLTQKPSWMSINPETGLITGTSDGTGGAVTVSVTLTKEHRLVHDKNSIVWGNESDTILSAP